MSSLQEFEYLFIKEAALHLMERGVPALLAENQVGFLIRRLIEKQDVIQGVRVELRPGRKHEVPAMCFIRQAVYLRIFQPDAIRDVWVRIQIPRHEVELIAPPPFQPAANGNAQMLADGTTGQPIPPSPRFPSGIQMQREADAKDRCQDWMRARAIDSTFIPTSRDGLAPKEAMAAEARQLFGISRRAFDALWSICAPTAWKKSGPRSE